MVPMTIAFDIDTVLADFRESFKHYAAMMGKDPETVNIGWEPPTQQPDGTWQMGPRTGDPDVWMAIIERGDFWRKMVSAVPSSTWERIRDLEAIDDVRLYFVTNRVGRNAKQQTEQWLMFRGLRRATVIVSPLKGEACRVVGADFHIDDKAGNAVHVSYHSRSTLSYILDLPKNQFDPNVLGSKVIRVPSVDAFLDDVIAVVIARR